MTLSRFSVTTADTIKANISIHPTERKPVLDIVNMRYVAVIPNVNIFGYKSFILVDFLIESYNLIHAAHMIIAR